MGTMNEYMNGRILLLKVRFATKCMQSTGNFAKSSRDGKEVVRSQRANPSKTIFGTFGGITDA
jgi:hypothetical protein